MCGPWSRWSHLNMGKSLETYQNILDQRHDNLWQVALAMVLFRYQQSNRNHFHIEQPQGSMMWHLPPLQEIREVAHWVVFDMCRMGDLRDSITKELIRKRLTVCTTSEVLHQHLNGRLCTTHKQIAGTTKIQDKIIGLARYTEQYPRKFARQVTRILKGDHSQVAFATRNIQAAQTVCQDQSSSD